MAWKSPTKNKRSFADVLKEQNRDDSKKKEEGIQAKPVSKFTEQCNSLSSKYRKLCTKWKVFPNKRILACIFNAKFGEGIHFGLSSSEMSRQGKIRDAEIIPLFEAINSTDCTSIIIGVDLSWNRISDAGTKLIAEFLQDNKFITTLNLKGNNITNVGGIEIAKSLCTTDLTHRTEIILKKLDFTSHQRGDETVKLLAALLLKSASAKLQAGNCDVSDEEGWIESMTQMIENKSIKELNIQNVRVDTMSNEMGSILSKVLAQNRAIAQLNISFVENGIGNDGVKWISKGLQGNHTLKTLDLACNGIGCDGLASLASVLIKSKHTANDQSCSLKWLSLRGNPLGNTGAGYICSILEWCESLEYLDLRSTGLSDQGLHMIACVVANLKQSKKMVLKTLLLDGNQFGRKSSQMWKRIIENRYSKVLTVDIWSVIVQCLRTVDI